MSDISGQLIKDSYSYILQVDTSTGYVYRVNGNVPVNPIFSSGLTVFSAFTFVDGNQSNGYVLTSDANGNSRWASVSGASVSSVTASTGLSGNSTTGAITLINTAPDQTVTISGGTGITTGGTYPNFSIVNTAPDKTVTITGGTNIQIVSNYPNFGVNFTGQTSFPYLPLSGGTVTGDTIFQSGLTANTISATTYSNLPNTLYTGDGTLFGNRVVNLSSYTLNFSSSTNPNTLVLSGGNVGIGTETPSQKLDVSGNTNFTLGTGGFIKLVDTTGGYPTHLQASYGNGFISNNSIFNVSDTTWKYSSNGAATMLQMEPTSGQFIFYTANAGSSGDNVPFVETIRLVSGNTGINVSSPTNKLHVSDSTNPIRLEGLTADTSDTNLLSVDGNGVVHTYPLSGLTGTTSSGDYLPLSGGTVTGNTIFQSGLTANTLNVTGNTLLSGLTAATISATTYLNYPDTFVTGFTLSSNTITLSQNRTDQYSAFTISLSAYTGTSISGLYLPLSGGTVTGNTIFNSGLTANTLNVSGNTLLSGLTASTISATTYQNVNAVTGGTYSNGTITLSGTGNFAPSISGFPTTFINDYLPLSGGTVSGATNFTNGLTANTMMVGSGSISASAVLESSSTTKGFLPPRMTESQRIAISSPATGLMVYQTDGDEGLYINKSFGWVQII